VRFVERPSLIISLFFFVVVIYPPGLFDPLSPPCFSFSSSSLYSTSYLTSFKYGDTPHGRRGYVSRNLAVRSSVFLLCSLLPPWGFCFVSFFSLVSYCLPSYRRSTYEVFAELASRFFADIFALFNCLFPSRSGVLFPHTPSRFLLRLC